MKRCVFTIVRDEAMRLPLWLGYYSRWFAMEDIVVLDNDSIDGSTDNLPCKTIRVSSQYAFSHEWLLGTVQWWFQELLKEYDLVIFAECDEMLWHSMGLGPYLDTVNVVPQRTDITAKGYELIHLPDHEPVIDMSRPIGEQRKFWFHRELYSKTLIANHPCTWCVGFHSCLNRTGIYDDQLLLVHLHRMDYVTSHKMHVARSKMRWSPQDLQRGYGAHNLTMDEDFIKWYYGCENPIVEIPEDIRSNFGF